MHKRPETVEWCARGSVGRDDAERIRRKTFLVVKSEGAKTATPAAFATKRGRGDFFEAQPIFILRGFWAIGTREEAVDARFVFGECLEASQRCSDDFKMDAFKSENGSEIGTSSSSVTDDALFRRRFEAKEPDKTLLFWSIFGDVFYARTRCERAPGVSRRRGRLESPRDEAQGPARASALLRDFLRSGTRRKIRISISSKKVPSFR